jgi:hypothetical protein
MNHLNKNNSLKNFYALLLCFFFFNFLAPEIFFNVCECRGVLNNGNEAFALIEEPLVNTDTTFVQRVLALTNISRIFITINFVQILEPIFIHFPTLFQEALFPVEYANELMLNEPEKTNQEILQNTMDFISQQLQGMNNEERDYMLDNIIITPEECQTLVEDFRGIYDNHMIIRSSPVNLPRN